LNIRKM